MACACTRTLHVTRFLVQQSPTAGVHTSAAAAVHFTNGITNSKGTNRGLARSARSSARKDYKLLVVGAGTAGTAIANKFASRLGRGRVAVLEPSPFHYYQPMFTLVGVDRKKYTQTMRNTRDVLPKKCDWIQDKAAEFDPDNNSVITENGDTIKYDYMVVAMGLQLNYNQIDGLNEALEKDPRVCSNFSHKYVQKTWPAVRDFQGGNAIFTFPNTPIKCAGAGQKICYLVEDYFRQANKRDNATVIYSTSLPTIFGIPKYADSLMDIISERDIKLHTREHLVQVRPDSSEAVFEQLDSESSPKETKTVKYDLLHVTPPMSTPYQLWSSPIVDHTGYVDVDRNSLQHVKYPNIFSFGDCANLPTSKTAAACAGQSAVVSKNLKRVMSGKEALKEYDGYTSCPLVITKNTCIMAEFGYDGKVMETFPFDQSKPRKSMYFMKADVMPPLYWMGLIRGMWNGPKYVRKLLHLGMDR